MLLAPHAPGIEAYVSDSSLNLQAHDWAATAQKTSHTQPVRWNGTLVLESDGREESFAIGPDGCVWNLSRPAKSDRQTSSELLPTGLKATSFAASLDAHDRLVVLAAHGQQLHAVIQKQCIPSPALNHWRTTHCSKFSEPFRLELPPLPAGSTIVRVLCEGEGSQLHVGVLVHSLAQGAITLLAARWQEATPVRLEAVEAGGSWRDALLALQRLAA